jgi:hypothetical protein
MNARQRWRLRQARWLGGTTLGCVASAVRCREDDTMRRIDDAVGVDPIDFESGYPELV